MSEQRTESAVQRIEVALARIAKVADGAGRVLQPISQADAVAAQKHEKLQETVSNALKEIDELIEELGQ